MLPQEPSTIEEMVNDVVSSHQAADGGMMWDDLEANRKYYASRFFERFPTADVSTWQVETVVEELYTEARSE